MKRRDVSDCEGDLTSKHFLSFLQILLLYTDNIFEQEIHFLFFINKFLYTTNHGSGARFIESSISSYRTTCKYKTISLAFQFFQRIEHQNLWPRFQFLFPSLALATKISKPLRTHFYKINNNTFLLFHKVTKVTCLGN